MPSVPLSLYVHLPWCASKCPYCDFNSYAVRDELPAGRYVDALLADVRTAAGRVGGRRVQSIFIGGGTPSLFPAQQIRRLLEGISDRLELAPDVEITMEANPGSLECGDPAGYRNAGVNRLSIGAQSFDADALAALGRIHRVDDIERSVTAARDGGFDNINLDVMYGLPAQTLDAAIADLDAAMRLVPDHVSWYQLTLEPNTVFFSRPPAGLPDDELAYAIQLEGQAALAAGGYRQYEVSAYARDGRQCRHNLNYWSFGDYLAVGAGAHGKLTTADGVFRYRRPANPEQYMRSTGTGAPPPRLEPVAADDLLFEFMLNALRLTDGFDEHLFEQRTGLERERLIDAAGPALRDGLIGCDAGGRWRPTELGARFLNDLQAGFLA